MIILFLVIYFFFFSQISCNDCFMGLLDENKICHKCPENCISCLNQTYCETCSMDYVEKEGMCISVCSLQKSDNCTFSIIYSSSGSVMIDPDTNLYIPIDNSSQPDISSHRFTFEVSEFSHEFHLRFWFKLPADLQENISILLMTQYPYPLDYLYKYPYIMSLNFSNGMLYGPFHFTINPGLRINLGSWNHLSVNYGKLHGIDKLRTVITIWNFFEENPVETQTNFLSQFDGIHSRYLYLYLGNLFREKNFVQIRDAWIMLPPNQPDSGELQFFLSEKKFFKFFTDTSVDPINGNFVQAFTKDVSSAVDDEIDFEISPLNITLLHFQLVIEEIFQNCLLFSINSYTGEIIYSSRVQFENSKLVSDYLEPYKDYLETLSSFYFAQNEEKFVLSSEKITKIFETLHNNVTFKYTGDGYCKTSLRSFKISRNPWVVNTYSDYMFHKEERNCSDESFEFLPNICVRLFQCPNNSSRRVIDTKECNENCEVKNCAHCENQSKCTDCLMEYNLFEGRCIEKCPADLKNFNRICVSKCPDQTIDNNGTCIYCAQEYQNCLLSGRNKTCYDCLQRLPEFCTISETLNTGTECDLVPKRCLLWQRSESTILCKLCFNEYKLFNNTCVSKCPDGFYDDDNQRGCVSCNLEKNYVENNICKTFNNIQFGIAASTDLRICPKMFLDNKCLNKISSIPGCIFEIEGLCYQCKYELIKFKGRCFHLFYQSHLNLINFNSQYIKNPITKKYEFDYKFYICPSSCQYCFMKFGRLFCNEEYHSENFFKVSIDHNFLSFCNPEIIGCFREYEGITQFCTERKCIGFPKPSYYMLPKDPGVHLIHGQGDMYKVNPNIKLHHSMIKVKNFLICKDSSENPNICFIKCPQGFYESTDKTECLPCHESCIECSDNGCLRYTGQINFQILLNYIKKGYKFYSEGMIGKRFIIGYSRDFKLDAFLEFSESKCPRQCEVCSINIKHIQFICTKCIPGMILKNNECVCANPNEFFDHETWTCTSSCKNFELVTSKGKECVKSCFEISAYTFTAHPFTLGNRCVSKCPHNFFAKTEFMYFEKIECTVNEAYLALGDVIEYANLKYDVMSLVRRFGIFQVSLISPVFCPVEELVYEKFDTIKKKLIFLDFIFGKTNELKYFPDFYDCLLMIRLL